MKVEEYFIFEYGWNKEKLYFSSERYINENLQISRLTLLHFHLDDQDYYLFYGSKDWRDDVNFSFQFNRGDEFANFLISNGAVYHRYDVADIIDSGYSPKFRLKDDQKIQYETYATGTIMGLNIYALNEKNVRSEVLLHLPIAKLRLYNTEEDVNLKESGESVNGEMPGFVKDSMAEEEEQAKGGFYYLVAIIAVIVLVALLLYYFVF